MKSWKDEIIKIVISFIIALIIIKIVFYNESFFYIISLVSVLYWLFFIPGYTIFFYWREKINFIEIYVMSFLLGLGVMGLLGYYLGIMGIHNKFHTFIPILFLVYFIIFLKSKKKTN